MKTLDIPKSGKCGNIVANQSRYGSCQRQLVVPANTQSPARQQRRRDFGGFAGAWGRVLTEEQRVVWNVAGPKVQSKTRLGSGTLSGQQLFQALNSARACIGKKELLLVPPAPVVFDPNPVGQLTIRNREDGVRLLLRVTGPVTEDIMVFGQSPCSAGRMKRRNVAYLGLLPAPQDGMSDITEIYVARYGEPRAGEKVFIVTCQQKDGWEGFELETSEIVPEKSARQQAIGAQSVTLQVHMHKGCTRDAQGSGSQAVPERPEGGKGGASLVEVSDEAGGSQEQAVAKTLSRELRLIPVPNGPRAVALALTRTGVFRHPD
jgi:hypothetical protein